MTQPNATALFALPNLATVPDVDRGVGGVEWMSSNTVRLPAVDAGWSEATVAIHLPRDNFKVVRIHAPTNAAQVVEFKAWRDVSTKHRIREAVGVDSLLGVVDDVAVALRSEPASPRPASVLALLDATPETIDRRWKRSMRTEA
jgi:hypothetical protein